MKPTKYSFLATDKIDLGTKIIYKYPTPTKALDIGKMIVNGRHPKGKNSFVVENECTFVMYVTKGKGIVYAGSETFQVGVGDVIFVPKKNPFAVEGTLEYITVDTPAFSLEQSQEVNN
ncbi:MAG: cupin domain-containing protein [bacterium]|nr:cupin domain-containing protein [bacterium]